MNTDSDIIRDLLHLVLEISARGDGTFTEQNALQVEQQIRHQYGGDEVYVQKTGMVVEMRKRQALEEVAQGKPLAEVSKRHGISRRTMYRLMEK